MSEEILNALTDPEWDPIGLSDETVGRSDGWRLARKSELNGRICEINEFSYYNRNNCYWDDEPKKWYLSCHRNECFRTKAPDIYSTEPPVTEAPAPAKPKRKSRAKPKLIESAEATPATPEFDLITAVQWIDPMSSKEEIEFAYKKNSAEIERRLKIWFDNVPGSRQGHYDTISSITSLTPYCAASEKVTDYIICALAFQKYPEIKPCKDRRPEYTPEKIARVKIAKLANGKLEKTTALAVSTNPESKIVWMLARSDLANNGYTPPSGQPKTHVEWSKYLSECTNGVSKQPAYDPPPRDESTAFTVERTWDEVIRVYVYREGVRKKNKTISVPVWVANEGPAYVSSWVEGTNRDRASTVSTEINPQEHDYETSIRDRTNHNNNGRERHAEWLVRPPVAPATSQESVSSDDEVSDDNL